MYMKNKIFVQQNCTCKSTHSFITASTITYLHEIERQCWSSVEADERCDQSVISHPALYTWTQAEHARRCPTQ